MVKKPTNNESTKSSLKSIKSLSISESTTVQTVKQKATDVLSPGKKKIPKHIPGDDSDSEPSSDAPSQVSNESSVIEIPDKEERNDKLSKC